MRTLWRPPTARPGRFGAPLIDDEARRAAPELDPLSFPFLEEYYDSRGLAFGAGADVNPWPDLSGNGRDMGFTGVDDLPTYQLAASPLGQNLVRFDGVDDVLSSGTISPFVTAARGHTFYCYGIGGQSMVGFGGMFWRTDVFTSSPRELLYHGVGPGDLNTKWRDSGGTTTLEPTTFGTHQWCYTFDTVAGGRVVKLYIDGILKVTSGTAFVPGGVNDSDTFLSLGNVPLLMDMGHFLWYSEIHDAARVALFAAWAGTVWGY